MPDAIDLLIARGLPDASWGGIIALRGSPRVGVRVAANATVTVGLWAIILYHVPVSTASGA